MTVSTVFEIHASEDEPIHALLEELKTLPVYERDLMTAHLMRHEADRRAEHAAASIALRDQEQRRTELIRATRAKNRALRGE